MGENMYLKDYLASRIVSFDKSVDGYDKIYYKVNENLVDLYKEVDFKDKDVLTVQASSDQLLTSRLLGSKKVDSFDMNRLTLYYYYLRKWSIKYMNSLYPDIYHFKWMNELLTKVKPETRLEKIALDFYKKHLINKTNFIKMFYDIEMQPTGKTIYKKAEELKPFINEDINFKTMNMFEKNNLKRKYDIVILSNILDWARNDKIKIENVKYNMEQALNKNGIVICSQLVCQDKQKERDIMCQSFDYQDYGYDKGYIYIKK